MVGSAGMGDGQEQHEATVIIRSIIKQTKTPRCVLFVLLTGRFLFEDYF